jgi:hypothetical protein
MNQLSDVSDRQLGYLADFPIAEVVLKFELEHLLLPWRQGGDDAEKKTGRFFVLDLFVWGGTVRRFVFQNLFVEISNALFLSADVERAIAANREKPLRRRGIGLPAAASLQLDKGFLDDIAGAFAVAEDPGCILKEGQVEPVKQGCEFRLRCAGPGGVHPYSF